MRRPSCTRTASARAAGIWVLLLALVFAQGFGALHRAAHGFAAAQAPGQGHAHAPSHSHSHGGVHAHDWADSCDHELLDAVLGHAAGSELCQQLEGLHHDVALVATSNALVNWEPARAVRSVGTAPPGKHSCLTPPARGPPLTV